MIGQKCPFIPNGRVLCVSDFCSSIWYIFLISLTSHFNVFGLHLPLSPTVQIRGHIAGASPPSSPRRYVRALRIYHWKTPAVSSRVELRLHPRYRRSQQLFFFFPYKFENSPSYHVAIRTPGSTLVTVAFEFNLNHYPGAK